MNILKNIFKKIQEHSSEKKQKQREEERLRELASLLCSKKAYYDPREQLKLLIDLDDVGIGFPGDT